MPLSSSLLNFSHVPVKFATATERRALHMEQCVLFVYGFSGCISEKVRLISAQQMKCNDPGEIWD